MGIPSRGQQTVTLEQLDQLLADWKAKLDRVSQNLIELHSLPIYQRLTGLPDPNSPPLVGTTQAQVTSALDAMTSLFQSFDLLVATIEQAVVLRNQISRFRSAVPHIQEIEHLLTGPSIALPVTQIPLAQRDLLSASEAANAITPTELLTVMMNAFQVARDTVLAVEAVWMQLEPQLHQTEAEIQQLQALAKSLHLEALPDLALAHAAIGQIRHQLACDPLGVSHDYQQQVAPIVQQARTQIDHFRGQQRQLQTQLDQAQTLLEQLKAVHQAAVVARKDSQAKVVETADLPCPLSPAHLKALQEWLTRLHNKFADGLVQPVQVGLDHWFTQAQTYVSREQATLAANQQPIATRQELRGRLEALKAKAQARGLAEDRCLTDLALAAQQLLYTRPTPLGQAAELVQQYERQINGRS